MGERGGGAVGPAPRPLRRPLSEGEGAAMGSREASPLQVRPWFPRGRSGAAPRCLCTRRGPKEPPGLGGNRQVLQVLGSALLPRRGWERPGPLRPARPGPGGSGGARGGRRRGQRRGYMAFGGMSAVCSRLVSTDLGGNLAAVA